MPIQSKLWSQVTGVSVCGSHPVRSTYCFPCGGLHRPFLQIRLTVLQDRTPRALCMGTTAVDLLGSFIGDEGGTPLCYIRHSLERPSSGRGGSTRRSRIACRLVTSITDENKSTSTLLRYLGDSVLQDSTAIHTSSISR